MSAKKIELLQEHLSKDAETCERALRDAEGNFWQAAYALGLPPEPRAHYANLLDPERPEETLAALEALQRYERSHLMDVYIAPGVYEVVGQKGFSEVKGPPRAPEEAERCRRLLDPKQPTDVIRAALNLLRNDGESLRASLDNLKALLGHPDPRVVEQVLSVLPSLGAQILALAPELEKRLAPGWKAQPFHFSTTRMLIDQRVPPIPALRPALERLLRWTKEGQVRDFTKEALARIAPGREAALATQEQAGRERELKRIEKDVLRMKSASELHAFVDAFNWDGELAYLRAVLQHPKCDLGTARMIYWRARPTSFAELKRLEDCDIVVREVMALVLQVEALEKEGRFSAYRIAYDPRADHAQDMTEGLGSGEVKPVRGLAERLKPDCADVTTTPDPDVRAAVKRAIARAAAKKPVAKKPVAKKPVAKKPVAKKPVAKKLVAKKPGAKKSKR
ncbi:MAG: DUF4274 domain-containing protein [Myxococcales bacterium]